ncbi:MAG: T9SS type A sorting domain-containing protein [Calditrichia bacterium]
MLRPNQRLCIQSLLIALLAFFSPAFSQQPYSTEYYQTILERWNTSHATMPSKEDSVLSERARWNYGSGGPVSASGNHVYVAHGATIQIVYANAAEPYKVVGELELDGEIISMLADDSLLFVNSWPGLKVFDITEPTDPVFLGVGEDLFGAAMVREGNRLFMTGYSSVVSVNITDLANPLRMAETYVGGEFPTCLAVKDGYVYAGGNWLDKDIQVLDATAFDSLNWVGRLITNGSSSSAQVVDSYLYALSGPLGMLIYDISQPSTPLFVNYLALPLTTSRPRDIAVSGNQLFMSNGDDGLITIDISDRTHPKVISLFPDMDETLSYDSGIAATNGRVYAGHYSGLRIISADNPQTPIEEDLISFLASPFKVLWINNRLYIGCYTTGFWVFDVTNPEQPQVISNTRINTGISDMSIDGDIAYFATEYRDVPSKRGVMIYDISNLNDLRQLSHFTGIAGPGNNRFIQAFAKSDSIICIANGPSNNNDSTLQLIDVSNSEAPQSLSKLNGLRSIQDIVIKDEYLYIATAEALKVFDISIPENPIAVSSYKGFAAGIVINTPLAHVLSGNMTTLGIIDPANPSFLSEIPIAFGVGSLRGEVLGNYLYWTRKGIGVVDISNPLNPVQITHINDNSFRSISAHEDMLAAVHDGPSTVRIFQNNELPVGLSEELNSIPNSFVLKQNFPNPFNPTTNITFSITQATMINLSIFDITGRHIRTLVDKHLPVGEHAFVWDSRSDSNEKTGSGIYFYRLSREEASETRKMILLR